MPARSNRTTLSSLLHLQEGGLILVVLILGLLLTLFGGTVKLPKFHVNEKGQRERVFVEKDGERIPVFEERNKFLNAQNLAQLAKDTSFIAIMAVGATFVIIAGQIDLSVGAIYALASVLGALVFKAFGPTGSHGAPASFLSVLPGLLTCVGVATLCGLINGSMVVALRVH